LNLSRPRVRAGRPPWTSRAGCWPGGDPASDGDKAGLKLLVLRLFGAIGTLQIMWADSGYDGATIAAFVKTTAARADGSREVADCGKPLSSPHLVRAARRWHLL
jgi:hypothetical protein